MHKRKAPLACPAKASLKQRPRMTYEQASAVELLFGVLANDTRLRLLQEIACRDEATTVELAEALEMKPQALSNQLQRLQDKRIVAGRRDGNNVYYRIVDNCVIVLLERGLCLIEEDAKRAGATETGLATEKGSGVKNAKHPSGRSGF
jgi:ArsR family transcriptional regulator, lead/cadmium/zinc/bismuth-responsive transcriptional repressor